uniref:Allatostatin CC n=1 Tax=Galleria mellonella TaxID=7137 RepID=A0AA50F5K4_GALME|nr:allatostatin CC [Galleria mellonella]
MMCGPIPLLLVVLSTALAAPAALFDDTSVTVPQKRAALVLDRLLIALQKALHEDGEQRRYDQPGRDWPRTAPLRIDTDNVSDMTGLQRRGQAGPSRGRVLRCYFNAVTCF